jgi:hypothetical protein
MNTANKLYETFTKSTDPKEIFDTAHEIKQHFIKVTDKDPADEIGEELLYLLGGKKETFEWLLLLTILFVNDEKCSGYLSELNNKKNKISIKQSEWAIVILSDIKSKMSDTHLDYCSKLVESLVKEIEIRKSIDFEERKKDVSLEKIRNVKKNGFWKKFGFNKLSKLFEQNKLAIDKNQTRRIHIDYFDTPINTPAVCSDDGCPCGSVSIPYGGGYLFISQSAVEFRKNARSDAELKKKAAAYIKSLQSGGKTFVVLDPTIYKAILICEKAAKRRGLNLHVAAADAKYAWETGKAPLRPTPFN